MSYILEALKKVEQKRAEEESPTLLTFSGEAEPERRKRAIWPYLLIGALFLNAIFLVRWLVPSSKPVESSGSQRQAPLQRSQSEIRDEAGTEGSREASQATPRQERVPQKGAGTSTPARSPEREAPEASSPQAKRTPTLAVTPAEPTVHEEKRPAPSEKVHGLAELPPDIRSALPEFKISGHAYSPDPRTRVVRINEKILQEGQNLSSGLRVEEIVQEGIVLSYQGYRFSIGINNHH